MTEPTFTLAEIHERHVQLEAERLALLRLRANPTVLLISPPVDEEVLPGRMPVAIEPVMTALRAHLYGRVPEILDHMDADLALRRHALKTDATAAYVAFMGGD